MKRERSKRALVEVSASAKRLTTTSNLTTSPHLGVLNEGKERIVSAINLKSFRDIISPPSWSLTFCFSLRCSNLHTSHGCDAWLSCARIAAMRERAPQLYGPW